MILAPAIIPSTQQLERHQEYDLIHVIAWIEHYPGVEAGGDIEEVEFDFANNGKPIGPRLRAAVKQIYGDLARVEHWENVPSIRDLREELEYELEEF